MTTNERGGEPSPSFFFFIFLFYILFERASLNPSRDGVTETTLTAASSAIVHRI